jgi:hypothetical protein
MLIEKQLLNDTCNMKIVVVRKQLHYEHQIL